jgi:hypothetical protein
MRMTTRYWLFHYLTSSCYCSAGTDLLFMKELKLRNSKLPKQTKTQNSENAGFSNSRPKYLSLRPCISCPRCSENRLEIFTTFFFSSILGQSPEQYCECHKSSPSSSNVCSAWKSLQWFFGSFCPSKVLQSHKYWPCQYLARKPS